MLRTLIVLIAAAVLVPATASAQLRLEIEPPKVRFEVAPAVVSIAPGIQVVPELEEEVFYVSGYYWVRNGKQWFRARGPKAQWVAISTAKVPPGLIKLRPGKYRYFKAANGNKHRGKHHRGHGDHTKGNGKKNGKDRKKN